MHCFPLCYLASSLHRLVPPPCYPATSAVDLRDHFGATGKSVGVLAALRLFAARHTERCVTWVESLCPPCLCWRCSAHLVCLYLVAEGSLCSYTVTVASEVCQAMNGQGRGVVLPQVHGAEECCRIGVQYSLFMHPSDVVSYRAVPVTSGLLAKRNFLIPGDELR